MAGLGKKTFVAGEVLLAQEVNGYLMDQSVMVFGGTAARSSAIPTPTEGMMSYRTDDNVVEVFDGSAYVGVGGGASSGLTLIGTFTFSGAVSHDFGDDTSPIFSSTYDVYRIIFHNIGSATSNQNLKFRVRDNTTNLTSSTYGASKFSQRSTTLAGVREQTTSIDLGIIAHTTDQCSGYLDIANPFTLSRTSLFCNLAAAEAGVGQSLFSTSAQVLDALSYNGFNIFAGTNLSGNLSVYGYNL
jgi:hypothetical protein